MPALAGLQLIPGQTTLGAIRLSAQQRSNQQNNRGISPSEWTSYCLDSVFEMYAEIVKSYGDNYKISLPAFQFSADGNTDFFVMPEDFFKALLVEWVQTPGSNLQNVTLQRMNFLEKNFYSNINSTPTYAGYAPHYTDVENTLLLAPRPNGGNVYRLWYIPRSQVLYECGLVSLGTSSTSIVVQAGDVFTVNGVSFTAGTSFAVGANDAATATNLVTAINASRLSGLFTATNLVTATQATNDVMLSLNNLLTPAEVTFSNSTGEIYFSQCYTGQTVTVNGVVFTCVLNPPGKNQFQLGATDALTATSFANAFNASGLQGAFIASATGTIVTLTNAANLIALTNPCQSFSFTPGCTWTNWIDGVNGWERLIVADVAIKVLGKYGRDTSAFDLDKASMLQRLRSETKNRDAGSPKTMIDVYKQSGYGGTDGW